jgi:hypothetical protein
MIKEKEGGSAFPHESGRENNGMTLRDYMAAKAMAAMLVHPLVGRPTIEVLSIVAVNAYTMADAMLEARK